MHDQETGKFDLNYVPYTENCIYGNEGCMYYFVAHNISLANGDPVNCLLE